MVGGKSYTGHWYDMDPTGVARLVFDQPLPAGPMTLAFDYTGKVGESPSGLFHAQIDDKWYGWSQFESIDARAAFPGFDEPGFKVPFTVTIRTPKGQSAVSNAPEVSSTVENGWQVHRFAPTLAAADLSGGDDDRSLRDGRGQRAGGCAADQTAPAADRLRADQQGSARLRAEEFAADRPAARDILCDAVPLSQARPDHIAADGWGDGERGRGQLRRFDHRDG